VFAQQASLGTYPADQYDLKNVVVVQSTLLGIIALWVAYGAAVVGTAGIATLIGWIIKDLSIMCYNKVFPMVEGDLKKFEEWAKSNNMNVDKAKDNLENGKKDANAGNSNSNGGEQGKGDEQTGDNANGEGGNQTGDEQGKNDNG